jgi:DNA-directed RNA polymerase subunit F
MSTSDSSVSLEQLQQVVLNLSEATQALLQVSEGHEERLTRSEERIIRHEERMAQLQDVLLGQQALMGILSEQTAQLKRTNDYLLSKDGGTNAG